MATPKEEERNIGIGLIVGGAVAAGLLAVLIWVGTDSDPMNLILIIGASFGMLLPAYLIGLGIKKIVSSA